MRIYTDESRNQLAGVICNQCKKELSVENGIIKKHSFDLCEECYDKMIKGFAIPVEEEDVTELL